MFDTPADLAQLLLAGLEERNRQLPPKEALRRLPETMYSASLRTEEGESIEFHVAYVDPEDPDPDPPPRVRSDRWQSITLGERIPYTEEHLTKLAKATDPRSSSLAVFSEGDNLFVWGLIDQGNAYFDFLNYDLESAQAYRPGLFQASIDGPAHLSVWIDHDRVGELRGTSLAGMPLAASEEGPLHDALTEGFADDVATVTREVAVRTGQDVEEFQKFYLESVRERWLETLCRILIRMRNYGHGGALLITPDAGLKGLNAKYQLPYTRLREALATGAMHTLLEVHAADVIHEHLEDDVPLLPAALHLDHLIETSLREDAQQQLDGVVWFVSLLSRVDGLVLLRPSLELLAFGVEIIVKEEPTEVCIARDPEASQVEPVDSNNFGTRHRSMMRYCAANPGSVGLVVSQDGHVRAFTTVGERLVMWDNVKIQQHDFSLFEPEDDSSSPDIPSTTSTDAD